MLTFALAVLLLIATPGPGVLSTAGVLPLAPWPVLCFGIMGGYPILSSRRLSQAFRSSFRCRLFALFCCLRPLPIWGIWRFALRWQAARLALLPPQSRRFSVWPVFTIHQSKGYAVNTALFTSFAFYLQNIAGVDGSLSL